MAAATAAAGSAALVLVVVVLLLLSPSPRRADAFLISPLPRRADAFLISSSSSPTNARGAHLRLRRLGSENEQEARSVVGSSDDDDGCDDANQKVSNNPRSRRDLLARAAASAGGGALSSFLLSGSSASLFLPSPSNAAAIDGNGGAPKTVVLTGGNSGIGFEAAKRLASQGHRVVLPCRRMDKAEEAAARIREATAGGGGTVVPAECDLTNLASVRSFAEALPSLLLGAGATTTIDRLCLNAGIARNTGATDVARTADGFELTVGTNHFGHFYLHHLLLPYVDPKSGRIVVTASGVHDPASPGGAQGEKATLGTLEGLEKEGKACEMVDGGAFNADKAYKDSKVRKDCRRNGNESVVVLSSLYILCSRVGAVFYYIAVQCSVYARAAAAARHS